MQTSETLHLGMEKVFYCLFFFCAVIRHDKITIDDLLLPELIINNNLLIEMPIKNNFQQNFKTPPLKFPLLCAPLPVPGVFPPPLAHLDTQIAYPGSCALPVLVRPPQYSLSKLPVLFC